MHVQGVHNQIYAASIAESLRLNGTTHSGSMHTAAQLAANGSSLAHAPATSAAAALDSQPLEAEGTVIQASRQRHRKHQRPRTRAKVLREEEVLQQQPGMDASALRSATEQQGQQRPVPEVRAEEVAAAAQAAPAPAEPAADAEAVGDGGDLGPALPGPNDEDAADAGALGAEQASVTDAQAGT